MTGATRSESPTATAGRTPKGPSMLVTRLVLGLSMVAVLLAILILDERLAPWYPAWLLTALVINAASAREVVGLLNQTSAQPSASTVLGGTLALVVANWAPHVLGYLARGPAVGFERHHDALASVHALAWPLWTYAAVIMIAFITQSARFSQPGRTMATIAGTILAVSYIGVLGSFIIQARWLGHGVFPVAALVATAKGADTGAYALGRIAGRHKLWPRLSPNKTVEGALGGLAFGIIAALITFAVARSLLSAPTMGWLAAAGFGLVVGTAAQLGDLMESMIKRDCARKDASATLPGFGGVLDVMDSLLFAGPVAYGYWLAFSP